MANTNAVCFGNGLTIVDSVALEEGLNVVSTLATPEQLSVVPAPPVLISDPVAQSTNWFDPAIIYLGVSGAVVDNGQWSGDNLTFSYEWFANGVPFGADSNSVSVGECSPLPAFVPVVCVVTATNAHGSAQGTSNSLLTFSDF